MGQVTEISGFLSSCVWLIKIDWSSQGSESFWVEVGWLAKMSLFKKKPSFKIQIINYQVIKLSSFKIHIFKFSVLCLIFITRTSRLQDTIHGTSTYYKSRFQKSSFKASRLVSSSFFMPSGTYRGLVGRRARSEPVRMVDHGLIRGHTSLTTNVG